MKLRWMGVLALCTGVMGGVFALGEDGPATEPTSKPATHVKGEHKPKLELPPELGALRKMADDLSQDQRDQIAAINAKANTDMDAIEEAQSKAILNLLTPAQLDKLRQLQTAATQKSEHHDKKPTTKPEHKHHEGDGPASKPDEAKP